MIGWVLLGSGSLSFALLQPWETSGCVCGSGWNSLRIPESGVLLGRMGTPPSRAVLLGTSWGPGEWAARDLGMAILVEYKPGYN